MRKQRPRPIKNAILTLGILAPLTLAMLGFDLDRGELKCEQAAAYLAECCPSVKFPVDGCVQEGGCGRTGDETIVASDESDCIRAESCDELVERGLCDRLAARIETYDQPEAPSTTQLYQMDWLCD